MAYKISGDCMGCDVCRPQCPTGAIHIEEDGGFWINPVLCNNCEGFFDKPQCVLACDLNVPIPYQAMKGRSKLVDSRPITSPELFTNGKNSPFASAIVIWEACNLLAQRKSLPWKVQNETVEYQRSIHHGQGLITLKIADNLGEPPKLAKKKAALEILDEMDIRAACLHLLYAAHATTLEKPWEEEFVIGDHQIEAYLGLDKRKDLSKPVKLNLIKDLAETPCWLTASIDFPKQGKVPAFSLTDSRLWHLKETQHHFQEDELGCKHLVGLTFKVQAGEWAKYFLNKQDCKEQSAFYQYGNLPKTLISTIMSIWQQHEGAARMLLWLLFKTRIGREQRITVPTLMRVAYGEEKVIIANAQREERKRIIKAFENDLSVLEDYGLKPEFDPVTYPPEIRPLWSKLAGLPDDAEEALEFWIKDGSGASRLTDAAPRGKWNLLMNARILSFALPADWEQSSGLQKKKKRQTGKQQKSKTRSSQSMLSSEEIVNARKSIGLSQRQLAEQAGKSQSWIRDIENGRFQVKAQDQAVLKKVLRI
ncbi:MAG: helix-turn-helix domain-containing protein [Leptolyngbya sp. Prado105]|jgi:DNA-binding transcriptional regulator YiaG|nr:helix-turn-helix domain-containing protein [Leptolyngbya sp. Prado105]